MSTTLEGTTILAVSVTSVPRYARVLRGRALAVRGQVFVLAARASGASDVAILRGHVLPHCVAPALVLATLGGGNAILMSAGLSFLGLGTKPPAPEWGNMLSLGIQYISNDPFMVVVPGLAITLTVLSVTVVGRDLRRRAEGRA